MTNHTKIWRIPKPNPALQELFKMRLGISRVLAQILINRGITTLDEARVFLSPDIGALHDPFLMKDMDKAVARVRKALKGGEKIRIFGDYDVDGITGTSVLMRLFLRNGASADWYIPGRLTEGYGMNTDAVLKAHKDGVTLIITVDNGISCPEEVLLAKSLGIDVIITDHHEPPEQLPQALAVVNPKQGDCPYPFKHLAGVGVAFKLGQALFGNDLDGIADELFALTALGTIADIVPLKGENRILAKRGLSALAATDSFGLHSLMERCGVGPGAVDSRQVAFQVAPRINAAGRLGDASVGVRLLLSQDEREANILADRLCGLNEQRQYIEERIYKDAVRIIREGGIDLDKEKVIVLAGEGWHLGVIGIVASKLVNEFYRPVILLSTEGNLAKGSARSIGPFDIYEALKSCDPLLEKYGGHKQAAGLTLPQDNISALREKLNNYALENLAGVDLLPEVFIDSIVELAELDEHLFRQMQMLAPFGHENPGPILACRGADVLEYRTVGSDGAHLKMRVRDKQFVFDAIGFNLGVNNKVLTAEERFDLVFSLEKNEWNGRASLQLNIKDFKPSVYSDNSLPDEGPKETGFIEELFQNAVSYLADDYYRNVADWDEFYTKVVGVTFDNRQEVVAGLKEGERLNLVREPDNPYDPNAIRVEKASGLQVGYLNSRLAKHFAPLLDRGEQYDTFVSQVTGGADKNYGVNIVLQKAWQEGREEHLARLARLREELSALSDDELLDRIRRALLGNNPYREKQLEALEHLFMGRNTLAIFGTGRGKSAVFQSMAAFKALRHQEMTVIIYPLRALVNDQYENMSARLEPLGLRVYKGNGSISSIERAMLFDALEKNEVDVLLTTPEFISHHAAKIQTNGNRVGFFVVDESHHIGMSTQSHRPLYKKLGEIAGGFGAPVTLAVTATAHDEVADEIIGVLGIEKVVIDPHVRTNLRLVDKRNWPDKNGYLKKLARSGEKTIVYVNSRLQTVELAAMLRESVPEMANRIIFYHAGLTGEQRNKIENMFRTGEVTVVVSTSAFGEGIDIPDVKNVVVYHLNFNFTEFNQQCGRSGRDGETAYIHLLCGERDASINEFILETSAPDRDNLVKLYLVLKELALQSNPITLSNEDIAQKLKLAGVRHARPNMVSAGLGILGELQLIHRETIGRDRQIYLLPAPEKKINLECSLRFLEGQEEKKAFDEFRKFFFQANADQLLGFINRPIFPRKYLSQETHDSPICDIM